MTPDAWRQSTGQFEVVETTYTVDATVLQIAKAKPERIGLLVSNGGSFSLALSTLGTVTASDGIQLGGKDHAYEFYAVSSGGLCTVAWYAIGGGMGGKATVIEVLYKTR